MMSARPPVLVGKELPGPAETGLHLVGHEERLVPAAQILDRGPYSALAMFDTLALDGLDDEGGHVALGQLLGQASASPKGTS